MGQQYTEISDKLVSFVEQQKIFFVGTAAQDSKVNISPKGMDSLRVLDSKRIIWLNVTGSGNETSAHVQQQSRMTLMFVAFDGNPMILRIYGQAQVVHMNDPQWAQLISQFEHMPGARQIFDLKIEMVQTSCGMAVPFFDYQQDREQLRDWASNKGEDGVKAYWQEKNQLSLDGKPTNIVDKNG
ncbi:MAG: pyridoxamine 5'-phosphate oxidase family protein [Halioglobus sp.]